MLRDEELVGVVSRADLLRALEGPVAQPSEPAATIAEELQQTARLREIVEAVAALGEHSAGVYLVGGTVRDILLGEQSFDVDIAVEGDAIAFAYALGGRCTGGRRPIRSSGPRSSPTATTSASTS